MKLLSKQRCYTIKLKLVQVISGEEIDRAAEGSQALITDAIYASPCSL